MGASIAPCPKCKGQKQISRVVLDMSHRETESTPEDPRAMVKTERIDCPVCYGSGKWIYALVITSQIAKHVPMLSDDLAGQEMDHLRMTHRRELSARLGDRLRGVASRPPSTMVLREVLGNDQAKPYEFPSAVIGEETIETEREIRTTFQMGVMQINR